MTRVLLDTNVWVSAFLAPDGHCGRLVRRILLDDEFMVVTAPALMEELADVLARPRLTRRYGYAPDDVRTYAGWIWALAERVEPVTSAFGCRDPDDDIVCGTAMAGNASYLVTRDDDLKRDRGLMGALARSGVEVISVSALAKRLGVAVE